MSSANEIKKLQDALKTLKASKAADNHASRLAKKEGEKLPAALAELEKRRGLLAAATTEKDKKKYEKMVETAVRGVEKIRANIEAMSAGPKTRTRKAPANGVPTGKRAQAAAARQARAALLAKGESFYCYKAGTNGKTGKYSGLLTITGDGEVDWVEEEKKISVASRSRATSRASSAASTRASSPVSNKLEGGRRRRRGSRKASRKGNRKSRKGSRKATRKARSARRNRKH